MKFGGLSMTLGAAGALALAIVGASLSTTAGSNPDADADGVVDLVDNCLGVPNPVNAQGWQDDCDLDGFGDQCDADLNNNGISNSQDFGAFGATYFKVVGDPTWNHCADMNANGAVNGQDFGLFGARYFKEPGPSGLKCASTVDGSANLTGKTRCWFLPTHRVRCSPDNGNAEGSNHEGILTDAGNGRDLRFINKKHYADLTGSLGQHCVYPPPS